VLEVAQ
jgi:hypothetical protein